MPRYRSARRYRGRRATRSRGFALHGQCPVSGAPRVRPGPAAPRALRRADHRWRRHRRGCGAGRRRARAVGGARRGARSRGRHVEPVEQAHPRRPALPRTARIRAGARGAARTRPALDPARAASRAAGADPRAAGRHAADRRCRPTTPTPARTRRRRAAARPLTRCARSGTAPGSVRTSGPVSRSTTRSPASSAVRRSWHAAAPAPVEERRPATVPVAARGRHHRRDPLLRRAGRRRAVRHDDGPDGGQPRRGHRDVDVGRGTQPGRPRGDRCARPRHGVRRGVRRVGAYGRRRDRCVERRHRRPARCADQPGAPRAARTSQQGCAPGGAAVGDLGRRRPDPAYADVGAVRAAVGRPLDHRHHRHRLVAGPGAPGGVGARHRLPARTAQRLAGPAGATRGHRGRLRRAPAAAVR